MDSPAIPKKGTKQSGMRGDTSNCRRISHRNPASTDPRSTRLRHRDSAKHPRTQTNSREQPPRYEAVRVPRSRYSHACDHTRRSPTTTPPQTLSRTFPRNLPQETRQNYIFDRNRTSTIIVAERVKPAYVETARQRKPTLPTYTKTSEKAATQQYTTCSGITTRQPVRFHH